VNSPSAARSLGTKSAPRFASALSTEAVSAHAIRGAIGELEAGLGGSVPDLVVAFATHHHGPALDGLGPALARATGTEVVVGCTAESVIGGSREVEGRPGLALWAASLPDTEVRYFEVSAHAGEDGEPAFSRLPAVGEAERACMILMADPFTFPVDAFLAHLNDALPGVPAMGGMASGAMGPGQTLFFTADGVRDSGCVGVTLEGPIALHAVVSQGCRPVGKPWVITECERNQIQKMGGRPALEILIETWNEIASADPRLRQCTPFIGLAIDPRRCTFERGDFLVRGIMRLDQRSRSIAVTDFVRRGQTVQLLVRDAEAAGEDLRSLIASRGGGAVAAADKDSAGALIFSCNGRGTRMFGRPDHDASCVRAGLAADVPTAGFFAAGEIGPVAGQNFLHGFTASVALFRPRS
jgi:small ligand-binding sensory domain FIST